MLQTKNLTYTYDGQQLLRFPDIQCGKGDKCLLLGQSGSGKTTLLHLLGGLRQTTGGEVLINEVRLDSMPAARLDRFRGQNIGIVFQKAHFVRSLNVRDNLLLAQRLAGKPTDTGRINELLERLNVGDKLKSRTDALSIGEQQRVAIARALINRPAVILADEPTSALDDVNCEEVIELLEQQASEENATLLIVTHDGRLKSRFSNQIILSDTKL